MQALGDIVWRSQTHHHACDDIDLAAGMPASAMVGTSGSAAARLLLMPPERRSLPSLTCGAAVGSAVKLTGV